MVPYQNNFTNSGDRDPKYINVTGVSLGHGHVVRVIPAEDDAVSLPDQLLCGCGRNRAIQRGTSSKLYMNVSSPLGSISAQDIRSAGYGKDSNLDNSTNDLDSRNAHDMAPFSSKSEDTMTSCDSRYMNMKKSSPNYGHWGISRHSCPLKRPFNKDSLYDEVGTRHVDDDVYVPPQSCTCNGENGHSMEATCSTKMQYMNVPNPLMSISSEDIRNIRYVEGSNCYHCTNDLKSRSAQDIRLNSHACNSQGSGTSVHTNDSLLQTPVKPGYNVAVVEKRPYEKHGCSDSELSQKPPIININSVYEDVRCDGAATDTALYAGLEYSTSNLGRGKSEDVDCDIYDNTCAVTHNTQFPSPKCRAPIKDKHGCSNSACNKISPNTSFIYDDVISDEAVKDDRVYVNVDSSQSPSKSDRVNSDGSNCELYDDTCTIAGNRNLPPQISKAPNDEETYGEVYVTQEHLDRKVGRLIQFWSPHREAGNEPEYLTVLANWIINPSKLTLFQWKSRVELSCYPICRNWWYQQLSSPVVFPTFYRTTDSLLAQP